MAHTSYSHFIFKTNTLLFLVKSTFIVGLVIIAQNIIENAEILKILKQSINEQCIMVLGTKTKKTHK